MGVTWLMSVFPSPTPAPGGQGQCRPDVGGEEQVALQGEGASSPSRGRGRLAGSENTGHSSWNLHRAFGWRQRPSGNCRETYVGRLSLRPQSSQLGHRLLCPHLAKKATDHMPFRDPAGPTLIIAERRGIPTSWTIKVSKTFVSPRRVQGAPVISETEPLSPGKCSSQADLM